MRNARRTRKLWKTLFGQIVQRIARRKFWSMWESARQCSWFNNHISLFRSSWRKKKFQEPRCWHRSLFSGSLACSTAAWLEVCFVGGAESLHHWMMWKFFFHTKCVVVCFKQKKFCQLWAIFFGTSVMFIGCPFMPKLALHTCNSGEGALCAGCVCCDLCGAGFSDGCKCGLCLALFWWARSPASCEYAHWHILHLYGFSPESKENEKRFFLQWKLEIMYGFSVSRNF